MTLTALLIVSIFGWAATAVVLTRGRKIQSQRLRQKTIVAENAQNAAELARKSEFNAWEQVKTLRQQNEAATKSEADAWNTSTAATVAAQDAWKAARDFEQDLAVKQARIEYLLDHLRQIRALADGVKHLDPAETKDHIGA